MKKINIIDTQFAHGTSLGSGDLKIYPKNFIWDRSPYKENKFIFVTESGFNNLPLNQHIIAFIIEPYSINPWAYEFARDNQNKFTYILSHDKEFNRQIPNSIYYPFGGCWIHEEDRKVHQKTKLISIIASDKKQTEGHKLRHEIIEKYASIYGIDVFGRGYKPIDNKLEALKDYCYSIVIENEFSKGWFTEKLIDVLQTGTIPIYQGSPDIHDYFDGEKAFVNLKNIEELLENNKQNPGAMFYYYKESLNQINKMFKLSKKYTCPEDWIFEKYPHLFV